MEQNRGMIRQHTGVILLIVSALLVSVLVRMPTQGASSAPAAPCLSQAAGNFVFALAGYRANGDGSYTLTWQVTNTGKHAISYMAFGTGSWTRAAPEPGRLYTGELGDYQVEWTRDRGQPGFASVKYETQFAGFSQGSTETFTLVVGDFDPTIPIQVQAKAGRTVGSVTFTLAEEPACDRTPATPTPTTPFSPLPTPTATPEGYALPADPVVPQCLFDPPPGGIPADPIIPLDAYTFAEPQMVLTHTSPIGIQQWLPDSETLLVTRFVDEGSILDLVNTRTQEITTLLGPNPSIIAPKWLDEEQTVVWLELDSHTKVTQPGHWIQSYDPPASRRLSNNGMTGWSVTHDVSPDGTEVVFLALPGGTQPLIWNQESKTLRGLPLDLAGWRYGGPIFYRLEPFNVQWHPGGEKLLFWDGAWVFLYDLTTSSGCEIDVRSFDRANRYVFTARWSPNGRYLLFKNTGTPPFQNTHGPYDRVLVLDTYTGEAVQYALGHPVASFTWAPDSQTVAMRGGAELEIGGFSANGFYLLNVRSGDHQRILPALETLSGMGNMLVWSPDGNTLAIQCMDSPRDESGGVFDRICISQVAMNR